MPGTARNFWGEVNIDGYMTTIKGGPKNKEGGFTEEIYFRSCEGVKKALSISGRCIDGINLILSILAINGEFFEIKTKR
ncbi:hypothetical protein AUJ64_02480 [Candidatus Pacearchaeota archaeon CG1_02_39_14]|nr:MAG: hypothetical protein AUJ64_02480 [Candidatus Pacearchaeota archaeon CG1_02_39_14]